jgi:hypothetical protein
MDGRFYGYQMVVFELLWIYPVCVGTHSSVDVYLAIDSFWLEDWVRIGKLWEEHVSLYGGR